MPVELISASVREFLRVHVRNVTQIEILALLVASPEREWAARDIDQVLRSNEPFVAQQLSEFVAAGLLVELGGTEMRYRYQPRSEALSAAAAETVQAYRTHSVYIIETIFKKRDPAHSFAEAFRIRSK